VAFDYVRYQKYISSPSSEWHGVRRAVLDRACGHCERCGRRRKLEVHHWTYANLFREDPNFDLEALCRRCHKSADFIRRKALFQQVQLSRATGWTWGETQPFEIWAKRDPLAGAPTSITRPRATPPPLPAVPPALPSTRPYDFSNEPEARWLSAGKQGFAYAWRWLIEVSVYLWRYPYTDGQIIAILVAGLILAFLVGIPLALAAAG
jgi:hypothetical protein